MKSDSIRLLGTLAALGSLGTPNDDVNRISPKDIDVTPKEPIIPKGAKKYTFNTIHGIFECIAINQDSANKKKKKVGGKAKINLDAIKNTPIFVF